MNFISNLPDNFKSIVDGTAPELTKRRALVAAEAAVAAGAFTVLFSSTFVFVATWIAAATTGAAVSSLASDEQIKRLESCGFTVDDTSYTLKDLNACLADMAAKLKDRKVGCLTSAYSGTLLNHRAAIGRASLAAFLIIGILSNIFFSLPIIGQMGWVAAGAGALATVDYEVQKRQLQ